MSKNLTINKTALAKLLAAEDITIEHTSNKPSFDVATRTLRLPVWKDMNGDLYDTLIGHEIGHALYSPSDSYIITAAINSIDRNNYEGARTFLQVMEGARVERIMKSRFPGLKMPFMNGYKILMERDFYGTRGKDPDGFSLIDRLNLHAKLGVALDIFFTKKEEPFVDRLAKLNTWEDSVSLARDVYEFSKENSTQHSEDERGEIKLEEEIEEEKDEEFKEKQVDHEDDPKVSAPSKNKDGDNESDEDEQSGSSESDDSEDEDDSSGGGSDNSDGDEDNEGDESPDGEGDSGDGDEDSEDGDEAGDDPGEGEVEGDGSEQGDEETEGSSAPDDGSLNEPEDSKDEAEPGKGSGGGGMSPLTSATQEAAEKNSVDLIDASKVYQYARIPTPNLAKIICPCENVVADIVPLMARNIDVVTNQFIAQNKPTVNYLYKQFMMKKAAKSHEKTKVSKTGVLNMDKLVNSKFSDDVFKRNKIIPKGKKHGLVMFVDWSTSMNSYIGGTLKQALIMAMFCKKSAIPFEIYAFTTAGTKVPNVKNNKDYTWSRKDKELQFNENFRLIQLIKSDQTAKEYYRNMSALLHLSNVTFSGYYSQNIPHYLNPGSTPLNETIVASSYIADDFKKKHNLELVTPIILTDGDSDIVSGVVSQSYRYSISLSERVGRVMVLTDPVNKTEFRSPDHKASGHATTRSLVHMMRHRTNMNYLCFFLTGGLNFEGLFSASKSFVADNSYEKAKIDLKSYYDKNNHLVFSIDDYDIGYNELYIMKISDVNIKSETLDELVKKGVDLGQAFEKSLSSKLKNKILLNKFINQIAI